MKHNFFAGPAILPKEVLAKAGESAHLVPEEGLSILEMSHRGAFITNVMEQAVSTCKELLNVPDDYAILFLTGGASSQFYMTPMNILAADQTAAYIDTGTWSTKAIKEAKLYGNVDIVASSADKNFNYIPTLGDIDGSKYRYLHYTANNTIFGTQFSDVPQTDARLVCDMSSEMFSRSVDVSKYDIIYAGAQKNMGPAGTTLVIIKKDIVNQIDRAIPTMLNYETHIKKDSSFNTPPVFPIYVSMLTMQWVKSMGGVDAMAKINADKGKILYDELDRNALFKANVPEGSRSLMNVTFLLNDDSKNAAFLEMCAAANIVGIKGHRSVGGFRASIYNAMPKSSIEVLIDVMKEFERTHG
jgi:phosphoserine aminotransferase